MKKLALFSLIMFSFAISYAQELGKHIDYQYKREDANYHSYTVYLNSAQEKNTLDFVITSSFNLAELNQITVGSGENNVKLSFKKMKIEVLNDDSTLYNLVLRVNLSKVLNTEFPCESKLTLVFSKNRKVELPYNTCSLKKVIPTN